MRAQIVPLGAGEEPPAGAAAARLPRTVVVGAGYWGRNLIRSLAELGAFHGIIDSKPATAAELAERHGGRAYLWEEMLADPAVAALAIATPPVSHFSLAREALLAGKHVLVEKPLALKLADAEELAALARSVGRRLMVGHQLQYHPAYRELSRLVRDGALGRIHHIAASRLNFGKICQQEDALWALAPHDLSMILGLLGEEPSDVAASGHSFLQDGISDVVHVALRFPAGATADIRVSWAHPFKEQRLAVVGEAMMAVFDDVAPWAEKLVLYRHRLDWSQGAPAAERARGEPVALQPCEPLKEECRHFLQAIVDERDPLTDAAEGVRVLRVLERASRSLAARCDEPPALAQGLGGRCPAEGGAFGDRRCAAPAAIGWLGEGDWRPRLDSNQRPSD
jgi:UDP-2-acetamido-3-amino-2,3-dideoxy-glucuronate N-acetyltransferase